MDFNLQPDSREISAFRQTVRAWLAENMKGSEHLRWSGNWSTRENDEEYKFRRALAGKLGAKRWLFPTYPEKFGGGGMSLDHQFVLETEIDRYGLSLGSVFYTLSRLVAPAVMKFGTEEQKAELLPPMMRGELAVWQVLTEPQGEAMSPTARPRRFATATILSSTVKRSWSAIICRRTFSGLLSVPTPPANAMKTWAGCISRRRFRALPSSICT